MVAGLVPHAGWTFSGDLAASVFSAVKQQYQKVNTFVIFGAAHSHFGQTSALYDKGAWLTPLGEIAIDEDLAQDIAESKNITADLAAHRNEHSIEVQIPFIQFLFPDAKILPIIVPPIIQAVTLGEEIAEIIKKQTSKKIICIGSTDLTHYGPHYGFEPMGTGHEALSWATTVNDRRFIDLALKLEPEKMLTEAAENFNACGPGAAAATVAAAKTLNKTSAKLLAQTNSNEIIKTKMSAASSDSVGYAAIVF